MWQIKQNETLAYKFCWHLLYLNSVPWHFFWTLSASGAPALSDPGGASWFVIWYLYLKSAKCVGKWNSDGIHADTFGFIFPGFWDFCLCPNLNAVLWLLCLNSLWLVEFPDGKIALLIEITRNWWYLYQARQPMNRAGWKTNTSSEVNLTRGNPLPG